jgi:multisubunit Na+/H+ antiporter MnhG subunit
MLNKFIDWCGSNTATAKCTRTIFQGVIGVIIADIDLLLGYAAIPMEMRPFIAAMVMAILSPVQAMIGGVTLPNMRMEE